MTGAEEERREVLARLSEAAENLQGVMNASLLPPDGGSIAYALRCARSRLDVAAVVGGLQEDQGSVRWSGQVGFGVDEKVSRTILTAIKFDPVVRSAAAIRFSETTFRLLSGMFMECAETWKANPSGRDDLVDFAVSTCCSTGVPDVIAIHGISPETSVIWIFNEDPVRLASNIIILSNRIQ